MPSCETPPMDIIFIVDSSGSIQPQDYEYAKTFLMKVISSLSAQPETRVSIVLFSHDAHLVFSLSDNLVAAYKAAEDLQHVRGGTNITSGINVAHQEFSSSGRDGVPKVAILITDGQDSGVEVENLKSLGVILFTIGVGEYAAEEDLINWGKLNN